MAHDSNMQCNSMEFMTASVYTYIVQKTSSFEEWVESLRFIITFLNTHGMPF